jgi:hypothetical protein
MHDPVFLLNNNNCQTFNRFLARRYGLINSIILSHFIQLNENNDIKKVVINNLYWFECPRLSNIFLDTGIMPDEASDALKFLQEKSIIEISENSCDSPLFHINYEKIEIMYV